MPKYKVQIREVIYTDMEVDAKNLGEAVELIKCGHESVGTNVKTETEEMIASVYHSKGVKEVRLI